MKSGLLLLLICAGLRAVLPYGILPSWNECGNLNIADFYKLTNKTELNEYPWMARLGYKDPNGLLDLEYFCLGVLISRRYLITAAHCIAYANRNVDEVILGDWNPANSVNETDCDDSGACAPLPRQYGIEAVHIHPEFLAYFNDLALIRLDQDVEFNDYISPVCMPPPVFAHDFFVGQFLPYVGYTWPLGAHRVKTYLHVMGSSTCAQFFDSRLVEFGQDVFCGVDDTLEVMLVGSALLGVRLVGGEARNFFLIGILIGGGVTPGRSNPSIFVRVAGYHNWISQTLVK